MNQERGIIVNFTILIFCLINFQSIAQPDNPKNLMVSIDESDCTKVTLSWDVVDEAEGYNIENNHEYKTTTRDLSSSNNKISYTIDYAGDEGKSYSFKVRAFKEGKISKSSNLVHATICYAKEGPVFESGILPEELKDYKTVPVFEDNFDNDKVDTEKWHTRMRWGSDIIINKEQQYYIDSNLGHNPFSIDEGNLKIKAEIAPDNVKDNIKNQKYVSGVLTSKNNFKYGYYEMRGKLPAGGGLWPAFWLYYTDGNKQLREIDIMEFTGGDRTSIFNNYHYNIHEGNPQDKNCHIINKRQVTTNDFTSTFHTFGVEWTEDRIQWFLDGEPVKIVYLDNDSDCTENSGSLSENFYNGDYVSQQEMYIILNLAVAKTNLGTTGDLEPDDNAIPADFVIDYVRVYQKNENVETNNSINWNSTPTSITAGANEIPVKYSIDQEGLVVVQLFNADWDRIGQKTLLVSSGANKTTTLSLIPDQTPTAINYLQAKLLKPNWEEIGVKLQQIEVTFDGNDNPTEPIGNSITWNPKPTNVTSGTNQIPVKYSINKDGMVVVQLFNSDWNQIGQQTLPVSSGANKVANLALKPYQNPTAINYLQVKLLSPSWGDIGVTSKQAEVSSDSNGKLNSVEKLNQLNILPNPFKNQTLINYYVEKSGATSISIHSADGKEVEKLVNNKHYEAGMHQLQLDGVQLSPGVYFIHLTSGNQATTKKLYKY